MILKPQSRDDLAAQLRAGHAAATKIERVDVSALRALVEHHPEDMTASVEAGMTLVEFQERIRAHGQWLPIDPAGAERLTIGDLLALNLSGPRRLGYGTIRDYLLGIKVALADGQVIKAGGKVVKNVAGYDLCKLFVGARHTLGVIVEATFKLRPLPECEQFVQKQVQSIDAIQEPRRDLLEKTEPVALDAHNLAANVSLVAAYAGNREDVEVQVELAQKAGFATVSGPEYFSEFWSEGEARMISVLPSNTIKTILEIRPDRFVAHLGNGIIHYRGGMPPVEQLMPTVLMERVKRAYDPNNVLPVYSA